jgi:hypothetical protein
MRRRSKNIKNLKKRIQHEGGITREEVQDLIRLRDQPVETLVNDPLQSQLPTSPARIRAPPRCSDCHTVGHRRNQCPNRNVPFFFCI